MALLVSLAAGVYGVGNLCLSGGSPFKAHCWCLRVTNRAHGLYLKNEDQVKLKKNGLSRTTVGLWRVRLCTVHTKQ